ncbi:PilN domain-containing protein [Methylovulum psychrotolerans]|jgi:type IV pilus assembly protein PilN|uniref:Pilus assembly protein PilN n=1 Tax=Methylovulum psychrotolerans TaxID=1704499 RepID=A0A1Z4C1U3_9GAMM|nr:PilN domain-containing protein [Methylovulum psychrotolerans]ASF47489.1 pilus assembly protein PilN [Methylovulum psychrotolerans]MBT9097727.1 PilN domain-containing protein [Methylovulum psychrotolerans]
MAKINLLPWREELRKQKKQEFLNALALGVLVAIMVLAVIHGYFESLKSHQESRNKLLESEISLLDKKIADIKDIEEKKSKLLAKIDLLQKLQESRPEIVHLFDDIPKVTPDGVFLTKFTQTAADLAFEGKSQSNARVSAMMRNIEASQWMNTPTLTIIKIPDKDSQDQLSDFALRAKQGKKPPENPNGDKNAPTAKKRGQR